MDVLSRLEFLSLLKDAIWRRRQPADKNKSTQSLVCLDKKEGLDRTTPPPAECVYALMGFFEHRILPDHYETEMQALARLSMANDNDRFAERMISMLPSEVPATSCWYADNDIYEANLWDIEPKVQVAGITPSASLVLDGCRVSIIRWKDFPEVKKTTKKGFKRGCSACLAYTGVIWLLVGCLYIGLQQLLIGVVLLCLGLVPSIFAPLSLYYAHSGRVITAEPWLIGVEGIITTSEAEIRIYGTKPVGHIPPKITETATGSPFASPMRIGDLRKGASGYDAALQFERLQEQQRTGLKVFTLIDTMSNTLYYFAARAPPTVCVFGGREGGLGRFILCTEHCDRNELHKETVLRMPTRIGYHMCMCDWIAIGRAAPPKMLKERAQVSTIPGMELTAEQNAWQNLRAGVIS